MKVSTIFFTSRDEQRRNFQNPERGKIRKYALAHIGTEVVLVREVPGPAGILTADKTTLQFFISRENHST